MRAIVIGSAAGGGFPQWNCGCPNCVGVREGRGDLLGRTQDSVAFTSNGDRFALVNASPDILAQIKATPALWPKAPRHTPIGAVVLTNGDMDHVLGLFSLRESQPLAIYATPSVWKGLEASVLIRTLKRFEGQVVFRPLVIGQEIELADAAGEPLGIRLRAFAAPGKLPVHLVDLAGHAAVLFDGTFYREDELVRLGLSKAVAKDMAHMPISGERGSLEAMAAIESLRGTRKIYTHVNNTNPILADTEERRAVVGVGWEIAFDGMEIAT
jgi:pyrroloquinoline quinone biosynthesis protein B